MDQKYDAELHEHQGWASTDDHGNTVIKEFGFGKDDTEAPILLDWHWVGQRLSNLEGKILTVIEATVTKDNQKATKDIIRNYISEVYADVINTTHTEAHLEYMTNLCNPSSRKVK
jgi:hypothetical protein